MKKSPRGCLLIIIIPITIFGVMIAIWGWNNYTGAKASENWPSTDGVIVSSKVEVDEGKSADQEPRYTAVVMYKYNVKGYEYTADKVSYSTKTSLNKSDANRVVGRYPLGKKVKVYYNPDKNHIAVLEPGMASASYFPIVFGIMVAFFCILVIVVVFRKKPSISKPSEPSHRQPIAEEPPAVKGTVTSQGKQEKAKQTSPGTILLITVAMFIAGIFLLLYGINQIYGGYKSTKWPTTDGIVIESRIGKNIPSSTDKVRTPTFYPIVRYEYNAQGTKYTCNRIRFSGGTGDKRSKAKKYVDKYPVGKAVIVYYYPDDPKTAVLEPGMVWTAFMASLGGLVFLFVGVICYRAYRSNRDEKRSQYITHLQDG
jgi:hypothetical protein